MQTQIEYQDIEDFYAANEDRRTSGEADFGVWWTEPGQPYPKYRVSYIHATGEVYAVALNRDDKGPYHGPVLLLGVVPPDDQPDGPVGRRTYYRTLDTILEGWPQRCGQPGGLQWVRERLRGYRGL